MEGRLKLGFIIFVKLIGVFTALYFFICALSFLADGFRLVRRVWDRIRVRSFRLVRRASSSGGIDRTAIPLCHPLRYP